MFPASAGMNRWRMATMYQTWHVPRIRGDEPMATNLGAATFKCSPHPRG